MIILGKEIIGTPVTAKDHHFMVGTGVAMSPEGIMKVRKGANIRNRYNQAPHLTQNTNEKVATSQFDITNKSKEVSPFPADDQKASISRRA